MNHEVVKNERDYNFFVVRIESLEEFKCVYDFIKDNQIECYYNTSGLNESFFIDNNPAVTIIAAPKNQTSRLNKKDDIPYLKVGNKEFYLKAKSKLSTLLKQNKLDIKTWAKVARWD